MDQLKCLKCGALWYQRVPMPKECPKCQHRNWNKPLDGGDDEKCNGNIKNQ